MATKDDKNLAYQAGQNALTEPPERRTLAACPFPEGTEERTAWVEGLADAIRGQNDLLEELEADLENE